MPKYCVRKPFTVLVGVVMIIVLGVVSFGKITTDLLPSISFPYVMAVTNYPGASPEKVEKSITEVVERSLGRVNKVKNVSSVSSENTSMVMLEFEEDTNMDSAMVKLSTACEKIRESLPEDVGAPMLMEISPDMMATMTVGVDYQGKDIRQLSRFVEDELLPKIEREDGVASVDAMGSAVEQVEIRINGNKVDNMNDKILAKMDSKFAKAKEALDQQERELAKAESSLSTQKEQLKNQQDKTTNEMAKLSQQVDELVANLAAHNAQLAGLKTGQAALEKEKAAYLENYNPAFDERIKQIDGELANLKTKITAAEATSKAMEQQVKTARENYTKVEQGKMTAAAAMGAAQAQMAQGSEQLSSAKGELEKAKSQYESSRKEAIDNAGLDKLLDVKTLSQLIYAQNFEMPAGYIDDKENKVLLKVGDSFDSLKELKNMLLVEMDGIGKVRLSDVATVKFVSNSGDSYAKIGGNDAVILNITKSSVAGTSEVSKTLNQSIEELEETYDGLRFTMLMDQGAYIKMIINSVLKNLVTGAILAIIVLALFLRDARPTIVVAFSIPMSVLFAIVLMYFTNVTVNMISLSGLALGVGMLVDNSIVVIENIYRLRYMGVHSAKAAVLGARQVSGAIFASTLTTICVFLPIVFTDGMTRELFTDMGLTMAYSLFASLIVALTFVPAMSATVLKKEAVPEHRLFEKLVDKYQTVLEFCLKRKVVPIGLAILLLLVSMFGAGKMGMEMMPKMSGGYIGVNVKINDQLEQSRIYKEIDQLNEKIMKLDGVETVGAMSGNGMMMMGDDGKKKTEFTLYVQIKEDKLDLDSQLVKEIETIGEKDKNIEELAASDNNMDMSALGGSGMEVRVEGEDLDEMMVVSEEVMDILGKVKGFDQITNGQEEGETAIKLVLNKDALMKNGLTVAGVYSNITDRLKTEASAVTMNIDGADYQVMVVDDTNRLSASNLMNQKFEYQSTDGKGGETKTYQLKDYAKIEDSPSISDIHRENQSRFITVTAETEEGYNTALLSRQAEKLLDKYQAPEGIEISVVGEMMNIKEMTVDMFKMISLAVGFIYLIMVAQFQSLLSPFIVLFTIPLAFTGGLLALWISGEPISMIAMMGFLVLAGVVVNNGIVFVDYVNQLRIAGREKKQALIETGRARIRPILMTALTTILAMSTMAFSKEVTAEMSKGMAIVTIGGLAYATLMTLFIVPVLYDILFRRQLKLVDVEEDGTAEHENIVLEIDHSADKK